MGGGVSGGRRRGRASSPAGSEGWHPVVLLGVGRADLARPGAGRSPDPGDQSFRRRSSIELGLVGAWGELP